MKPKKRKPFSKKSSHYGGMRAVALFEGAKGLLVLLAGFELLRFIHKDLHEAASSLVKHLHINPARHYPRIFLDLSERLNDTRLWAMALAAFIYASVRLVEAVGLWRRQKWAEWFGALSGGIYIPVEIYEVMRGVTWPKVTVLLVNLGVVAYLSSVLFKNGKDV